MNKKEIEEYLKRKERKQKFFENCVYIAVLSIVLVIAVAVILAV